MAAVIPKTIVMTVPESRPLVVAEVVSLLDWKEKGLGEATRYVI